MLSTTKSGLLAGGWMRREVWDVCKKCNNKSIPGFCLMLHTFYVEDAKTSCCAAKVLGLVLTSVFPFSSWAKHPL